MGGEGKYNTRVYYTRPSALVSAVPLRFFFPWPMQPYQVHDDNVDRVAMQRRVPEDDQWMVPHNLCLSMFLPSSANVLLFDPLRGSDQARSYAGKYASKPEAWYYLQTESNGLKDWLKARTVRSAPHCPPPLSSCDSVPPQHNIIIYIQVGLCMAFNRLLGFHVVRSTRPVQFTRGQFVPPDDQRSLRDPSHVKKFPAYPDAKYYLNKTQQYFFRNKELRHLRIEQFNRYLVPTDQGGRANEAQEDTISDDEVDVYADSNHRHTDAFMEGVAHGTVYSATQKHVPGSRRRVQARLGVSRIPFLEPLGTSREAFYENRLLLGLAWYCEEPANADGTWTFKWAPPKSEEIAGVQFDPLELKLTKDGGGGVSFEERCAHLEQMFCDPEHGSALICSCCAEELGSVCLSCRYAVGWHFCKNQRSLAGQRLWRKGTLYGGKIDIQRVLFNLHRKLLPTDVLQNKAREYVAEGRITEAEAEQIMRAIEGERNSNRLTNDAAVDEPAAATSSSTTTSRRLTRAELEALLDDRQEKMRAGRAGDGITDQFRVYQTIIGAIERKEYLRMMVQASAGTGKSFLLTTVYLWCLLRGLKVTAAAPTGIAAANIDLPGTSVSATTIHNLFEMDGEWHSGLDYAKMENRKVAALMAMDVLLLDEVSMMDVDCWKSIAELLSLIDHNKRPEVVGGGDAFGPLHVILFGDFKQLPPATSKPPFVVVPSVVASFDFRVLRENRRVVADTTRKDELENFHGVLTDISLGRATERVRQFVIAAYVGGATVGCADHCELEGSIAVFSKRRYRDRWNRVIVRRVAGVHNHSLKVKARVRARGSRGQNWFSESKTAWIRKRTRTQSLWNLHLAGDFLPSLDTKPQPPNGSHMMRAMLTANVAVDQKFANGSQGRLIFWHPASTDSRRKALPASHPELGARFVKESSLGHAQLLPEADFMDITPRAENLAIRGEPVLLQVCCVPAYAITIHKSQAMSVAFTLRGSLEGIFAHGQLYVLISRATDPVNVQLVGVPPRDLIADVERAWAAAGLNVRECFTRAAAVTNEWIYDPSLPERFAQRRMTERTIPMRHRTLAEVLDPQPTASAVIHRLLGWIDGVDIASQTGAPRPAFATAGGEPIFPAEEERWWLTEVAQRKADEEAGAGDEDGPPSGGEGPAADAETDDDDPLSDADIEAAAAQDEPEVVANPSYRPTVWWNAERP